LTVKSIIKISQYYDSVSLMLVARELSKMDGVHDAAVVMATEPNKAILAGAGLLTDDIEAATANDLVIALNAASDSVADDALGQADELLKRRATAEETGGFRPKTIHGTVASYSDANIAVISVTGRYATDQAWDALTRGLHVLLFSDNVSLEDEIELKNYARDHGLLLMGPGAGTAIINNVALGFANALPKGPVGIVSAAGTGLQEVSTLLAKHGVGITQGIGTGGRDLKREVGGIMMLEAIKALQSDPATEVIVLISKPPADTVVQTILDQVAESAKPTVICFMGGDVEPVAQVPNAIPARTLQEAALLAAGAAGGGVKNVPAIIAAQNAQLGKQAQKLRERLGFAANDSSLQKYLRGLFSGGTLCYETQVIWREMLAAPVYSNAPLPGAPSLADSTRSVEHTAVDLGEEEFTVGRPHPMIDNDLRIRRLLQEARDPQVAVILLDVVLGYGAHPDPATELAPAIEEARNLAVQDGRELIFAASVTGTENDPQVRSRQVTALENAGVIVCESNAAAARLAGMIVSG